MLARNCALRFGNIIKEYLSNSTLHGLKYIVEDGRHWTERLFWIFFCGLSWWGCIEMVSGVLNDFTDNSIAMTVETTYLDWQTKFPSFGMCFQMSSELKAYLIANKSFEYSRYAADLRKLFTYSALGYSHKSKLKILNKLSATELMALNDKVRVNCTELLGVCRFNDIVFNCCDEFAGLQTTAGYCLMINSRQAKPAKGRSVDFNVNRTTGAGVLSVNLTKAMDTYRFSVDVKFYLLNDVQIPSIVSNADKEVAGLVGHKNYYAITLQDVNNEDGVKHVPISQRKCRFPFENEDNFIYDLYSYDVCVTEMQVERMLHLCGCVNHYFPRNPEMPVCNYTQLECLFKERSSIINIAIGGNTRCYSDCEEPLIVSDGTGIPSKKLSWNGTTMTFRMLHVPTIRYRRYILRGILDVLVEIGSAAGLFLGASILSVVEILYWLLLKPANP
ncbi:sodium channel protein Nach isoform X2 [Orussus abietinus]|uniref:sodium channel protein Nach isoform X2 n=1 Tax=Orussus abietinus TaxID=222816 RepID=UPI000626989F|nr:sodium channel protein Nach isoform X2 [Orussus abietinus]